MAVKTQPPVEVTSAAQMSGASSFWTLNDNGDLTTSKVQQGFPTMMVARNVWAQTPRLQATLRVSSKF